MAELPDLTVFAKVLKSRFKGKTLKQIDIKLAKKLNVTVKELQTSIEGEELADVTREGKTIYLHFTKDQTVRIHLMLRGELVLTEQQIEPKYKILSFTFADGSGFALVDLLKQATTTLNPEISKVPDALGKFMNLPYFSKLLSKKRMFIKTLLMDQHLIGGIGNSLQTKFYGTPKSLHFQLQVQYHH